MKKVIILTLIMFGFFNKPFLANSTLAYEFSFQSIDGGEINLQKYKDRVILIVNVASRCGFTPQYDGLQKIWNKYENKGLVVIGVPTNNFKQEPGSNKEIKDFCETNFGIDFPMTEKINVIGSSAHPFYLWAKKNYGVGAIPKWNFHKIIINKDGNIVKTFSSITSPTSNKFINFIEKELNS